MNKKQIATYLFDLDNYKYLLEKEDYFATTEEKIESRKHTSPHNNYQLLSFILRRIVLSKHLQCSPLEIKYTYNNEGKPLLLNKHLSFNVSHSHKWFFIGLTFNQSIGVDLENIDNIPHLDTFIDTYASSEQKGMLLKLEGYEKLVQTHLDWCLKESFVKARGYGIKENFKNINYKLDTIEINSYNDAYENKYSWSIDNKSIPDASSNMHLYFHDKDLVLSVTTIGDREDTSLENLLYLKVNPNLSSSDLTLPGQNL